MASNKNLSNSHVLVQILKLFFRELWPYQTNLACKEKEFDEDFDVHVETTRYQH